MIRSAIVVPGTFYLVMVAAGYLVEIIFGVLHLVPATRHAKVAEAAIHWNYTTYLNIALLLIAAALVVRFVRSDGIPMLKMMGGGPDDMAHHASGDRTADSQPSTSGHHHDH